MRFSRNRIDTWGQTDMMGLIGVFYNFAKTCKNNSRLCACVYRFYKSRRVFEIC